MKTLGLFLLTIIISQTSWAFETQCSAKAVHEDRTVNFTMDDNNDGRSFIFEERIAWYDVLSFKGIYHTQLDDNRVLMAAMAPHDQRDQMLEIHFDDYNFKAGTLLAGDRTNDGRLAKRTEYTFTCD